MMDASPRPHTLYVGVDIAAATATVAWLIPGAKPSRPFTIAQTPHGFSELHALIQQPTVVAAAAFGTGLPEPGGVRGVPARATIRCAGG